MVSLEPTQETLHGDFDRDRPPVLEVEAGQILRVRTLDVGWGLEPPSDSTSPRRKHEPRSEGPALCGPIAVRGAQPGDALEIELLRVGTGSYGFTYCTETAFRNPLLNRRLGTQGPLEVLVWDLREKTAIQRDHHWSLPTRPFPGTLGMPDDVLGPQCPWTPRRTGGNMDCRELVEGTRLLLPVAVPGGRISVGDGHARQGLPAGRRGEQK